MISIFYANFTITLPFACHKLPPAEMFPAPYLRDMSKMHMAVQMLRYQWRALTRYELHSPFLFDFTEQVLNDERHYYAFDEIEYRRDLLLSNNEVLRIDDFGAGSHISKTPERKVSEIARHSLISPKFGRLLFRMGQYLQPATILEMGTSLGISGSYLAKGAPHARMITLEGSTAIATIAQQQFDALGASNINLIPGEFSTTLPGALAQLGSIDLAFIDGNHQLEPTLAYFEAIKPYLHDGSIIIFDDIHWSNGMETAWNRVRKDPRVTVSIDLYYKGIIGFKHEFRDPAHVVLRY